MAKRNTGVELSDAPLAIGLGPGFFAGRDVHVVIETHRGHRLGMLIETGMALPDTGEPSDVNGYTSERIIKAPVGGTFTTMAKIASHVVPGQVIGRVNEVTTRAKISGILRGIMRDGVEVKVGTKLADIDPRGRAEYCDEISDKAKTISGGVLEAILMYYNL